MAEQHHPERTRPEELLSLRDKTAIVTGGAMGIGYGIAQRLSEAGANLVIFDINAQAGKRAIQTFPQLRSHFMLGDVTSEMQVADMVGEAVARFGSLDILVNNAGIYPVKPVLEMKLDEWNRVIAINLTGTFLTNQKAAKQMVQQGRGGKIINIGSVDSLRPWAVGLAHYDASKHAIWGFSKNFALELAPYGITVNVVAPGDIATPGSGVDDATKIDLSSSQIPLGRRGIADDIAKVVLSLASPISDYRTGTITVVDGGWLIDSK